MRNLTIRRHKSFVGCLAKYKVYMEIDDPNAAELVINDVPCIKLGELKNNDEQVFHIEENEARIFVIADKLSKNFCNDFIRIPAGDEDLYLSGKPHYNPANGHAFRFDGVADEETKANRKKGFWLGLGILGIAFVVGLVIGFLPYMLPELSSPKDFTVGDLSITLTDQFERTSPMGNQTAAFLSDDKGVVFVKESFSEYTGLEFFTIDAYAQLSKEANPQINTALQQENGYTYYEYTARVDGDKMCYITFYYKSDNAFWAITFFTMADHYQDARPQFFTWAKSVTFREG